MLARSGLNSELFSYVLNLLRATPMPMKNIFNGYMA